MNTNKIAKAVKAHLVNLAINDKLPTDMNRLSISKLEEVIKKTLPTERDKAIELAGHYLCESDDDLSIEQMIEAIANHEDQDAMIDNVEGVIVWEKVEYSFTCEDFLSEINW